MSASHQFSSDPAANAPDAAAYKGKGKAEDLSMDEQSEESEDENEELVSSFGSAGLVVCLFWLGRGS